MRAYNEVLAGELQPKSDLLQGVEANWVEEDAGEEAGAVVVRGAGCSTTLEAEHQHRRGRGWDGGSRVRGWRGGEHREGQS